MGRSVSQSGRCIVLSPVVAVPGELLTALGQRGLTVVVVCDPPSVMVELARCEATALIVCDPPEVGETQELVEAVRAYFPRTVCWQYRPQGGGGLMPVNGHIGHSHRSATLEADRQRLAPLVVHAEAQSEPLISAEELSMLLNPSQESSLEG